MESQSKELKKRPYHSPQLVIYGDIGRLTESLTGAKKDSGMGAGTDMTA